MSNEPLPARQCRLTFRNQSARRGVEEGCTGDHWVGGPGSFSSGLCSQRSREEKKRKDRREREGTKKKRKIEKKETHPSVFLIRHPTRAVTVYTEAPRSPRKVISLKNVISVRQDGVEEKKSLGVAEFFFMAWGSAGRGRRVREGALRYGAAGLPARSLGVPPSAPRSTSSVWISLFSLPSPPPPSPCRAALLLSLSPDQIFRVDFSSGAE